jgi:uncharacterized protein YrzB (UPF0473 family)
MLLVPVDTDDAELEEEVIAFRYEESEEGELTLFPIDDEEEWKIVEDTFQTLAEGEDYTLLAELVINGTNYAFFSNDDLKKDDEVFILKYAVDADGEYELITVDNDDEWEDVAEIFDEYMLQD